MKVVYATTFDHSQIRNWSGLGYFYHKMLQEAPFEGVQAIDVTRTSAAAQWWQGLRKRVNYHLLGRTNLKLYDLDDATRFARRIHDRMGEGRHVLSPNTAAIACLGSGVKKILYTDSTLQNLLDTYSNYKEVSGAAIRRSQEMEYQAIQNADLLLYTSQWAADSACRQYGAERSKVFIVPFGANFQVTPQAASVQATLGARNLDQHINLLFAGVEWERKGGALAVQVAAALRALGLRVSLHIVGVPEIPGHIALDGIVQHGFLSKASLEGERAFQELLAQTNFLLLPSVADCTPVVFSEANAFGVPCIASDVGGHRSVILPGINGMTFPLPDFVREAAAYIHELSQNSARYQALCLSSRDRYESALNWKSVGNKVYDLMEAL